MSVLIEAMSKKEFKFSEIAEFIKWKSELKAELLIQKEYIVINKGFSINELDEKNNEINF